DGALVEVDRSSAEQVLQVQVTQVLQPGLGAQEGVDAGQDEHLEPGLVGQGPDLPEDVAADGGDADRQVGGPGARGHVQQVVPAAQDGQATEAHPPFGGVVVQEGDRAVVPLVVAEHAVQQVTPACPRAQDDRAGAAAAG